MPDESFQVALPLRFTFQFDSVRCIDIRGVGPFSAEEADLLIEWLELVKRSIERCSTDKSKETPRGAA